MRAVLVVALLCAVACAPAPRQTTPSYVAAIGIPTEVTAIEAALANVEVQHVRGLTFTVGSLGNDRIVLARSGIGKVNAAMVATLLADHYSPTAVIFSGTAGALDPALQPGDIVVGTAVGHHDFGNDTAAGFVRGRTRNPVSGERNPQLFPASESLLDAARKAIPTLTLEAASASGRIPSVREGIIVTGDSFVANPARRDELRHTLNASAVEMEGAAVAQVCVQLGIPILVIRSITDAADAGAPESYQRFLESSGRNAAKLTLATIRQLHGR